MISTTGFPAADWKTRRTAIRRIARGAGDDLCIGLREIVLRRAQQEHRNADLVAHAVGRRAVDHI